MASRTPSRRKIRYAIIGLGHIAQAAVLPGFATARNSRITALVSSDEEKLRAMAEKYNVPHAYTFQQIDTCLQSQEVDAVYIATPNHLHREYAVRAAQAGKHVLCEKPMAVTVEDCQAMIEAAEANNVRLMLAYRLHFEAANLEVIRLAQSGELGDLRFFDSAFAQNVVDDNVRLLPVSQGGGPVYDMGVYCINAARYLFRAEPESVLAASASGREEKFSKSEEMTSVVLRFPGNRLATFTASFGTAPVGRYTLAGTKGTVLADPAYEYSEGLTLQVTIDEKTRKRKFPKRDQFAAEIAYFSNCILKKQEPEPSGYEGLADVRIIQAIYESANSGRVVTLPAFEKKRRPTPEQEIDKPGHGMPETVHVKSPSGEAA